MDFSNLLQLTVPTLASLGALGWVIYDKRVSGSVSLRSQIEEDHKIRRAQLEEQNKEVRGEMQKERESCANEIRSLNERMAGVEAANVEKDKTTTFLKEILQGRNPEMIQLLTDIKASHVSIIDFMKQMHTENRKELLYQSAMLEGSPLIKQSAKRVIKKVTKK